MGEPAEILPEELPLDPSELGAANNNDFFENEDAGGEVIPFPGVENTDTGPDLADLEPNEGPAFGSKEADEASKEFFEEVEAQVKENKPGAETLFDEEGMKKAIMDQAKKIATKELSDDKRREQLMGWIGQFQYNRYLKLRKKAVEKTGDIGLLAEFWNRLDAEEQTAFLTKNDFGIISFAKTMLKNGGGIPGMRESKLVFKYLKRNTAGRVPFLRRIVSGLKDWRREQVVEMVVYGVLDYKGDKTTLQVVQGNLGSIAKVGGWIASAVGTYLGGGIGGGVGKAAGSIAENATKKIPAIRETLQKELPTPPETPGRVQTFVKKAANKVLRKDKKESFTPTEPAGPGVPDSTIMGGPKTPPPSQEGTI